MMLQQTNITITALESPSPFSIQTLAKTGATKWLSAVQLNFEGHTIHSESGRLMFWKVRG